MTITGATPTMLGLADDWEDAVGSAVLSGINGDRAHTYDPGKHLSRSDNVQKFGSNSWPVVHPDDKVGPSDKACAIDITMSRADQNRVHNNFLALFRNRKIDPRAAYVYAFNGYNGTGQPMRYNLVNGASSITDSSHTWHQHTETFYRYVNDPQMRRAIMSVVRGESIEQYRGVVPPAPVVTQEEENVDRIIIPNEFAFDENKNAIEDGRYSVSVPVEPIGYAPNPHFGKNLMYVSLATDFTPGDEGVLVRVAIFNGAGVTVSYVTVKRGDRVNVPVPAAAGPGAYNIIVGRVKRSAAPEAWERNVPLTALITIV